MKNPISSVISGILSPVSKAFTSYKEHKTAVKVVEGKVKMAASGNAAQVTFNDQEWELVSKRLESETWKDEFVTVVIYSPVLLLIVGATTTALTSPDLTLFEAGMQVIKEVNSINTASGYGMLLLYVTLAAIGIKGVKGLVK